LSKIAKKFEFLTPENQIFAGRWCGSATRPPATGEIVENFGIVLINDFQHDRVLRIYIELHSIFDPEFANLRPDYVIT